MFIWNPFLFCHFHQLHKLSKEFRIIFPTPFPGQRAQGPQMEGTKPLGLGGAKQWPVTPQQDSQARQKLEQRIRRVQKNDIERIRKNFSRKIPMDGWRSMIEEME